MTPRCLLAAVAAALFLGSHAWAEVTSTYPARATGVGRAMPHPLQKALDAAKAGDIHAQRYVAHALEHGPADWIIQLGPLVWYERAAESGDPMDIRELACFIFRHSDDDEDLRRQAAEGMKQAAHAGDLWANLYYAKYLRSGYGVAADTKEATLYLAKGVQALGIGASGNASLDLYKLNHEMEVEKRCGPNDFGSLLLLPPSRFEAPPPLRLDLQRLPLVSRDD